MIAEHAAGNGASPGCFEELSPKEFNRHKEMVVLLMKAPAAAAEFSEFQAVLHIESPRELPARLENLKPGQALGIICPDGDCSGRLAIRLSNLGYPVYHLGGGLREWYHCFRKAGAWCA